MYNFKWPQLRFYKTQSHEVSMMYNMHLHGFLAIMADRIVHVTAIFVT